MHKIKPLQEKKKIHVTILLQTEQLVTQRDSPIFQFSYKEYSAWFFFRIFHAWLAEIKVGGLFR